MQYVDSNQADEWPMEAMRPLRRMLRIQDGLSHPPIPVRMAPLFYQEINHHKCLPQSIMGARYRKINQHAICNSNQMHVDKKHLTHLSALGVGKQGIAEDLGLLGKVGDGPIAKVLEQR